MSEEAGLPRARRLAVRARVEDASREAYRPSAARGAVDAPGDAVYKETHRRTEGHSGRHRRADQKTPGLDADFNADVPWLLSKQLLQ